MQQSTKQKQPNRKEVTQTININDILFACLSHWYWFLISLIIALSIALYKIATTQPTYTRYCEVLIKSKDNITTIDEQMANMANMGMRNATNAYNEIYTFRSKEVMTEVAKELNLKTQYTTQGTFHPHVLYGETLPATVELCDIDEESIASLTMDITPEGSFTLYNFKNNSGEPDPTPIKGELTDDIALAETPLGKILIRKNKNSLKTKEITININHIGLQNATAILSSSLSFNIKDSESGIITISAYNKSIEQADDILHTLIDVYSKHWIKDKNIAAEGTLSFIDRRLESISYELSEVDNNISSYKSRNLLPDVASTATMHMNKNRDNINQLQKLKNDLANTKDILRNLQASSSNEELPLAASFGNATLNNQIVDYNKRLLERNENAQKGGENNPLVKTMDRELIANREAIIAATKTIIKKTETEISTLEKETQKTIAEISKNPEQTKYLASAEREQSVKEKLYLFLLQKREENQLSRAFTAYKTRIITPPTGSVTPTAPIKKNTILMALAIGLLIPASFFTIKEVSNTRIRGRKDLEELDIPIIGEIPQLASKTNRTPLTGKRPTNKIGIVVEEGNRNIINEAFRVLRTNIEFMTKEKGHVVITCTSFNPGSGKTFCMINTAMSLAIKGEDVIVIDGDMRHASLSQYVSSPSQGLSNYLAGEIDNIEQIIIPNKKCSKLHILPVGTIPPNPTELLDRPRFEQLIEKLKHKYKYILIDCPPVEMVADTHIIEKFSDRTLFLVRVGIMERGLVSEIENLYIENKFKNLSIILNGASLSGSRYGYKYSYRYGYHSSYHYGNK